MIHECALEPELVATWVDRRVGRYFIDRFGLGQPRVVSRYPRDWKKLVMAAFGGGSDLDRTRLEVLLTQMCDAMVQRRGGWNAGMDWLANAEAEHARVAFHAILARANPRACEAVLVANEIDAGTVRWALPVGRTVSRTAVAMSGAVASLLRAATSVVLIDPHFGPDEPRFRDSLVALARAAVTLRVGGSPPRIELHCQADGKATAQFFSDECQRQLPRRLPRGLRVDLIRLRQRPGGERLHNRYILTELGGVKFGVGLDLGDPGDTDDLNVLDRDQFLTRWQQYAGDPPEFDRPEATVTVVGTG